MVEGVITIPLITVKPFVTGDRVHVVKGSGRGCFIDEIGHFYVKIGIISNHLAKIFKLITLLRLTLSPSSTSLFSTQISVTSCVYTNKKIQCQDLTLS